MKRVVGTSRSQRSSGRELLMPGTALAFSLLMLFLAPSYARWFGDALPAFSRDFFAFYPLWIAISTAALAIVAVGEDSVLATRLDPLWRVADITLALASALVIAGGIVALFLPVMLRPMPG